MKVEVSLMGERSVEGVALSTEVFKLVQGGDMYDWGGGRGL